MRILSTGVLVAACTLSVANPIARAADEPATQLEIHRLPSGGMQATAALHLPAPPGVVKAVLTDYDEWPALFDGRFRLAKLERTGDRVVTDLLIKRFPLPGQMRLLCETRELPDGTLVTSLIEGDFKRYRRRWVFSPEGEGGRQTRAEMDLQVEPTMWAPDWLFAMTLRRDLEAHFRIVRERAAARFAAATRGK